MYAWFKKQRISIYGKGNMTQITATVQAREDKKPNQLRAAGILPANIYGEGKSVAVQLKQQDFVKLYNQAGESGLIYLTLEGDKEKLIGSLAEKLTKMQIYQMLLESNASEQSSRMMAMKNASEASGEMIDDLTLVFNKARQSNITREISEISAGMASVQ